MQDWYRWLSWRVCHLTYVSAGSLGKARGPPRAEGSAIHAARAILDKTFETFEFARLQGAGGLQSFGIVSDLPVTLRAC